MRSLLHGSPNNMSLSFFTIEFLNGTLSMLHPFRDQDKEGTDGTRKYVYPSGSGSRQEKVDGTGLVGTTAATQYHEGIGNRKVRGALLVRTGDGRITKVLLEYYCRKTKSYM